MKVSLVREWDRWSSPAATGSNRDIEDFLMKNGIDANAGLPLSTRIAKYLSRKLGLPEGTLAKKIYAWRPLTVMADVFGAGSHVFVSRSLFTCYNKIRLTDGIKKEDKFRAMALAVADELPVLLEICEASYTHVVQPVLKPLSPGNSIMQDLSRDLRIPGVQMATDGDLNSLRKTSIPELLGICIPPGGFIEELGSVTGGDTDAGTALIRRQFNLHEHHEDGEDSASDDDDDDDNETLTRVHDQLADVFIQLRGLEFPEIGALGMPTPESPDIALRHRPLPVEVALQDIENLNPTAFFPEKSTFKTAHEYIRALLRLGHNRLSKTRNLGMNSREAASEVIFAYNEFFKHAGKRWIRGLTKPNEGPFVLMHCDMALHGSNLLWDEELNLIAAIDWEWCHTVPVSCFVPPAWLNGFFPNPIRQMCFFGAFHLCEIKGLCQSISDISQACFPQSPLAQEWDHLPLEPFQSVVLALLYPETIDDIFWKFIIYKIFTSPQSEVVNWKLERFLEEPDIKRFIDCMADQAKYDEAFRAYVQEYREPLDYRCWNCQREEQNFNILQELPRLSPPPSTG
ncbi:hypothetical protein BHE90_014789 [Fusarium euwallaceae]|uniref:Aminoglycoside phosphotransferase domain-containing protein n=1 Tax=Fusarium euwallaceae TaxID=1147111 RepID=A0A430L4Z1_9HYPO|nr:hypothetical protein BHE90_014789 [Fusarium euwallaceae]